jgi:DNA-binding NarL/FixJ family response regulator
MNAAPPNRPIRVVVADDNPLVPVGLRSLLEDDSRVVVVGEARSGGHALLVTRRLHPDVVLLDVPMATRDALPALPALVRLTRVLVLTYSRDPALLAQAMRRGATGYVVHAEYTTAKLVAAILDAHAGRRHLSPWAAGALPATEVPATRGPAQGSPRRLSRRETNIIEQVARGLSISDIARTLNIGEQTVKAHVSRILGKLDVPNPAEAAEVWRDQIGPPPAGETVETPGSRPGMSGTRNTLISPHIQETFAQRLPLSRRISRPLPR